MLIVSRRFLLSIFHNCRLVDVVSKDSYAAQAFSNGGTTVVRRVRDAVVIASLTAAAVAFGNTDSNNAMAPVTKGAATLVPLTDGGWPLPAKLVIPSPGALSPRRPMELPKFE